MVIVEECETPERSNIGDPTAARVGRPYLLVKLGLREAQSATAIRSAFGRQGAPREGTSLDHSPVPHSARGEIKVREIADDLNLRAENKIDRAGGDPLRGPMVGKKQGAPIFHGGESRRIGFGRYGGADISHIYGDSNTREGGGPHFRNSETRPTRRGPSRPVWLRPQTRNEGAPLGPGEAIVGDSRQESSTCAFL